MRESVKAFRKDWFSTSSVPLALLLLCLISYAPLIKLLGFYWDDWPSIFYLHFLGPDGFHEAFAIDRPLLGWIFSITSRFVGESTISWQIFGILTRWLCSLMLWWTLRLLWPDNKNQVTWVVFLFAIYPGFSQQYISVTYSNAFLVYAIFILSFAAMILAFRKPVWFWPLLLFSLACSLFSLFTSEYFFGLELLRPAVLFLIVQEKNWKKRLQQVGMWWLPYLALMALFLIWRVWMTNTPRGEIQIFDFLQANPVYASLYLIWTISEDFLQVSFLAWSRIFDLEKLSKFGNPHITKYVLITLITTFLMAIFLIKSGTAKSDASKKATNITWSKQAILLGTYAIIIAGWPFWVTYLPIKLQFPQDRFTMPMMIGACLLLVGLLELIFRNQKILAVVLGILIGFTTGFHYYNGLIYARAWDFQKVFFWQLTWRAPAIKPGTLLLTPELPFTYYSDNSLTAPLNWTYAPENTSSQISYLIYDLDARLYKDITNFDRDIPIKEKYRAVSFSGSTSQILGFFFAPPRCVTIIDPEIEQLLPDHEIYIPEALELSDPSLIDIGISPKAKLPEQYFGNNPAVSWCYYFEKADLARQNAEWEQIVELGNQAQSFSDKLNPENAIEFTPFVEGYAKTGHWEEAIDWSRKAYNKEHRTQARLCVIWNEALDESSNSTIPTKVTDHIQKELKCK